MDEIEIIEIVEVEVYASKGEPLPRAHKYVIRLDGKKFTLHKHEVTGQEILALDGLTPAKYKLYEHRHREQPRLVAPDEVVNLHAHHIERFTTMPKDTTEGSSAPMARLDFLLPERDRTYLDNRDIDWECIREDNSQWLILHNWATPNGYNEARVDIALLIPPSYPDGPLDMFWAHPHLNRRDGKAIGALSVQPVAGRLWQRWSRHRTPQNPWRPGSDDIASHLGLLTDWLSREFETR
jgi:hypothetical protein